MIRIILKLVFWLLRCSFSIVLFSLPWILKALIFAALITATSIGAFWIGVPKTVRKMSDEWVTGAFKAGVPPCWEKFIYSSAFVLAFLTLAAGWGVLAFTAAFIVRTLF